MRQPKNQALAPLISLQKLSQQSYSIANLIGLAKQRQSLDDKLNQCLPDLYKTHFKVNQVENSILFLTCDSAKLMTRFRMIQDQTISQLNTLISPQKITSIKIKIRPNSNFDVRQTAKQFHRHISKKNAQILIEEAEHTVDQNLKNILTNLAKHAEE